LRLASDVGGASSLVLAERRVRRQLEDDPRGFTALRGLQLYNLSLPEMQKAQHFAEEGLRVAERLDDAARLVGAHGALGLGLVFQGKLEPALSHFQRGSEIFDPDMQFPDWPGAHPGVMCQFYLPLISWMLGYPDRSLDELRAAVGSAETLGQPLTLAQTLCYAAFVQLLHGRLRLYAGLRDGFALPGSAAS
jgi:hypothetical protein